MQPRILSLPRLAELCGFLHDYGKYADCFQQMILTGKGKCPHAIHDAAAGLGAISGFVRQLKRDWVAAKNAVKQVWSNGPVEGYINRLKTLKRQMYGRPKFELLRARTLPLAA